MTSERGLHLARTATTKLTEGRFMNQQELEEASRLNKKQHDEFVRNTHGFLGSWLGRIFIWILILGFAPALLMKLIRWLF